jgi:hypothetical protein
MRRKTSSLGYVKAGVPRYYIMFDGFAYTVEIRGKKPTMVSSYRYATDSEARSQVKEAAEWRKLNVVNGHYIKTVREDDLTSAETPHTDHPCPDL